jgi:phage portal protein BeeE
VALLDRISAQVRRPTEVATTETRSSIDTWLSDYLLPSMQQFNYSGNTYTTGYGQSSMAVRAQEISQTLPAYSAALRACPPAFAAEMVRALVISQARFTFRNPPSSSTPRRTFGTRALSVLEHPAPSETTGQMLAKMEWHAGLAGNAYVYRQPDRLRVLRPDWVAIVFGSQQEPEDAAQALDGELVGYIYANRGLTSGNRIHTILPRDMCHWSPIPDPEMSHLGMSWITPAIREIQNDKASADYKIRFFANSATPNMVVKGIPAVTKAQFDEIVDAMEARHAGVANAFRTLYLTAGADATVVGNNFKDMDLKALMGSGETRIALLSRVPAPILGISEGLAGSSLNAGNFGMARRLFADTWVYPTLQDVCGSLADIVDVPNGAELWFDTGDMPLLREDAKDAAEIVNLQIEGITKAVREGFTAESAVSAVTGQDAKLLKHTGRVSVQLQTPEQQDAAAAAAKSEPELNLARP